MALTQHGSEDYVFGFNDGGAATIATAVGLKPQTLSINWEPEFTAEAQDENGKVASFVVADKKGSFTLTGYVVDEEALEAAESFTYGGKYFIVTGYKVDTSNTDFRKGEITGVSYSGIAAPPP